MPANASPTASTLQVSTRYTQSELTPSHRNRPGGLSFCLNFEKMRY